jgi:hypothetical protein
VICGPCKEAGGITKAVREADPPLEGQTKSARMRKVRKLHSQCTGGDAGCGCQHRIVNIVGVPDAVWVSKSEAAPPTTVVSR